MAKLACFLGVRRTSETHKSDLVSFASWAVFSCSLPASCLQTVWHAALVLPSNCLRVELPICMRRAWIITSLHQDRLLAVILSLGMIWTTANFYMIKPYPCNQGINHANHPSNYIYDICNSVEWSGIGERHTLVGDDRHWFQKRDVWDAPNLFLLCF